MVSRIEHDAEEARQDAERRFPDGFFQHPNESVVLMVVHTRINGGDAEQTDRLVRAMQHEIDELHPDRYAPDLHIYWGGTLIEVQQETEALVDAVRNATLLTIALVMLAIYVFFLRVRPIPLLSLSLIPPVLLTFGFAELTVNYLNASSAFLSSIVVGNGINPNIIWLARYFEARRAGEDVHTALVTSHRGTWKGTLTASLAAGVAYGSLMSTDYRGFRDFGVVGGAGMVLCWIGAYLLLPSLVVAFERLKPLTFKSTTQHKGFYGVLFARIALGRPRTVLTVSLLLTVVTAGLVGWAIVNDPMEYDFRRLRTDRDPSSDPEIVLRLSRPILSDTGAGSALAVLAPSREEAERFQRYLATHRDAYPHAYGDVKSVDDLLPADQAQKVRLLDQIRQLMLDIRPHVSAEIQGKIDEQIPPERIDPLRPADLPDAVARPYTERDGTRGRLFFIEHDTSENAWDGMYLTRWAAAARSLRARGASEPPPVAGTATVFADSHGDGVARRTARGRHRVLGHRPAPHRDVPRAEAALADAPLAPGRHPVDGGHDGRARDAAELPELRGLPDHVRKRRGLRGERDAALRGRGRRRARPAGRRPRGRRGHWRRGDPLLAHHRHRLHLAPHEQQSGAQLVRRGHGHQ